MESLSQRKYSRSAKGIAKGKAWRAANTERKRAADRKREGLPQPDGPHVGICECCGQPPGKYALALDHDHVTGAFRGWLCGKCNVAIGMLGDTLDGVLRAVQYLQSKERFRWVRDSC